MTRLLTNARHYLGAYERLHFIHLPHIVVIHHQNIIKIFEVLFLDFSAPVIGLGKKFLEFLKE